jgi:hypothetical protein
MRQYRSVIKTNKFPQLTRRVFTTADGLKSDNVTAMRFDNNGVLFVGTDKGLARFDGEKFSPVSIGAKDASISMIYFNAENHMFVGVGNSMLEFDGKKKLSEKKFSSKLIDIKVDLDGATWILTESVLYKLGENGYDIEIGVPGKGSCLAVYKNNKVYVGTAGGGLHALVGKRWHWSELMEGVTGILSNTITCLYMDPVGSIWVGTDKGVCVYDDNSYWLDHSKIDGLPDAHITGMAIAENGDKYFSTTTGLIHQHNGRLSYYGYKRWLPSPNATGVAISPDGSVCVSTDKGISLFETKMISLREKANELRAQTEKYNVRHGYVIDRDLEHEGVISTEEGHILASDNEGLWTGLYTAALCFEYACTKDPEVRKDAHRSLLAMIKLTEITGIEGFFARAIRYSDAVDYGTGARHEWHITKDAEGRECEWLGETSSDEVVGHFYCYANYFDLVADDEEKKLIADTVKKILDHIIDNNFRLVDSDGLPTTWANWDPDLLNNDHKWIYEKGTNSLQMLTFLKIGYHITGDEKYEKLFVEFAGKKHFAMNLMQYKIPDGHLLHIDDNHDFLMISLLMKYTDDPNLRSIFAMGLTHHWEDEKVERNAFFNFVYGAVTGEWYNADDCIDELMDMPMDQVMWPLYNSYRKDLKWDMSPAELGMPPQLYEPLPAHERRITSNDSNRFTVDSGAEDVAQEIFKKSDEPTAYTMFPGTGDDKGLVLKTCINFTHPYWYARYYGLIEDCE